MGGGGGQTQQSNQYSSVSPWAQPYVGSILGAAQKQVFNMDPSGQITGMAGYTPYGYQGAGMSAADQAAAQSSVAGFSPLQQQAFQGVANLQTPGQYGTATGAAGLGTLQALNAGQQYQQQATDPNAISAYMNPYIQNALQPQLNEIQRQGDIQSQQAASRATASGAFGGTRNALAQNEAQRNAMLAQQNAISQGYNQAFNQAQQAQQYGAGLGLQGAQAAMTGASTLGQLGTSQLAAQQGILGLQNQYGTQQQQQQQNLINQAMQNYQNQGSYGMQQLQSLKNLLSGFGTTDVTTTQEAAAPNTMSQIAGLGATGLGAYGAMGGFRGAKKGGMIKEPQGSGLDTLSVYNAMKGA